MGLRVKSFNTLFRRCSIFSAALVSPSSNHAIVSHAIVQRAPTVKRVDMNHMNVKRVKTCSAPRCVGLLEGEFISAAPVKEPARYAVWAEFAGRGPSAAKWFFICSKHFHSKHMNIKNGKPFMLLKGSPAIPTIHCEGPDVQGDGKEANAGKSTRPTSDDIVSGLNEAVKSTSEVKIEDDSEDDFQYENSMEVHESLPDVPQSSTQGIVRNSESHTRVLQSNPQEIIRDAESCLNMPQSNTETVLRHSELSQSNLNFVRPSDKDPCHIIEEVFEMYSLITLPYLEQANLNLQWVYRILSREEGCERIVYEYPNKDDKNGFVLIRDSKWDGINLDRLHLIAIAYRPGIMSLRDLGMEYLGLLQNIYSCGKAFIMKKFGVVGSQLRVFIQYAPSFYHLHVHFTAINDDICGSDFGTDHPLHLVIHNIKMFPMYYQTVPLTLCLKESDELFKEFEARGVVARIRPFS